MSCRLIFLVLSQHAKENQPELPAHVMPTDFPWRVDLGQGLNPKVRFCQGELKSKAWSDLEIDVCAECGGYWFDHDELGLYKARAPQTEVTLYETDTKLRCPGCETETLLEGLACDLKAHVCKECTGSRSLDAKWIPRVQESEQQPSD